jgi:hypothetical protein
MLGIITVLVAVLSLTFVSSTFAKYTSTVSGSDEARVAYWGINQVEKIEIELFSTAYDDDVQSNDTDKVIAPGTKKSCTVQFIYFETKAPEVDYNLSISTEGSSISSVIANNPNIRFSLNTADCTLTWEQLLKQIEALGDDYEAGTKEVITATIGWEWKFSTSEAQDIYDTNMGNMAHDLGIKLVLTATATQING